MVDHGGKWISHFPFLHPIHPTKQRNLFPFSPFLLFSSPFPQTKHSLKFHSMHKIEQSKLHCINIKFCSTIFFFFKFFFNVYEIQISCKILWVKYLQDLWCMHQQHVPETFIGVMMALRRIYTSRQPLSLF